MFLNWYKKKMIKTVALPEYIPEVGIFWKKVVGKE